MRATAPVRRDDVERRLRRHYERARADAGLRAAERDGIDAVLAAAERVAPPPRLDAASLIAAQLRFMSRPALVAPLLCVALVFLASALGEGRVGQLVALSFSGVALTAACLHQITAGSSCGMTELEAACPLNAHAAGCARLLVMGCLSAAGLCSCVAICSPLGALWELAARAGAPYLISGAGGLLVARRAPSAGTQAATLVWSGAACAACALLSTIAPAAYSSAASGAWCVAALVGAAWYAREAALWVRQLSQPLETPAPALEA